MEYINEVNLYGVVTRDPEYSHEFSETPFYSIDVEINRLRSNGKKATALVRCYFSGDQITKNDIKQGVLVNIEGKLINSKSKGLIDISVLVNTYTIIDEITDKMENLVKISGEVTKIFTTEDNYKGFINFVVAELDEDKKRLFSSRVVVWNRLAEFIFNNMKVGDKVLITGTINNSKTKSRPEDKSEPEDVVVSEILGTYYTKIEQ